MSFGNQTKACPNCNQPTALTTTVCVRCGHQYRTQFTGASEPQPTQMFTPPNPQYPSPPVDSSGDNLKSGFAMAAAVVSLIAWIIPIFGLPISITALCLSLPGVRRGKGVAIAALSIAGLTLCGGIANAIYGAIVNGPKIQRALDEAARQQQEEQSRAPNGGFAQ